MSLRRPVGPRRRARVEVVVPCYNYGRFLEGCVASVTSQPGVEVGVTVVDDCSQDDSAAIADRLADADRRVRVIHHEVNRGHIATYNDGLAAADSDHVVLLSADDLLAPGALGRAAALLDAMPAVGLAYGHPRNFQSEVPRLAPARVSWSTWRGDDWIRSQFRRGLNAIYSPEAVVRTSVQHQVGYYDPSLPHSGDLEMWLRVAAVSDVGHVNGPVHAYRRVHDAAMSQTEFAGPLLDIKERVRAYRFFLDQHPGLRRHDELRRLMASRAGNEALALAVAASRSGTLSAPAEAEVRAFVRELGAAVEESSGWGALDPHPGARGLGSRARTTLWWAEMDVAARYRWRRWSRWGM